MPVLARPDVMTALADGTRRAIVEYLRRVDEPAPVSAIAEAVGVRANSARVHLDRLRSVGLVEISRHSDGTVGRPAHLFTIAPDAPLPTVADPLSAVATRALFVAARVCGASSDVVESAASECARSLVERSSGRDVLDAAVDVMSELGFEPSAEPVGNGLDITFRRCPFDDMLGEHGDLVCALHRGVLDGVVDECGAAATTTVNWTVPASPSPDLPGACRADIRFATIHDPNRRTS